MGSEKLKYRSVATLERETDRQRDRQTETVTERE